MTVDDRPFRHSSESGIHFFRRSQSGATALAPEFFMGANASGIEGGCLRNFAILGAKARTMLPPGTPMETVVLDDVPVSCGIVETPEPELRAEGPGDEFSVLVRVKAFSLNYRDKNRIFSMVAKGSEE